MIEIYLIGIFVFYCVAMVLIQGKFENKSFQERVLVVMALSFYWPIFVILAVFFYTGKAICVIKKKDAKKEVCE